MVRIRIGSHVINGTLQYSYLHGIRDHACLLIAQCFFHLHVYSRVNHFDAFSLVSLLESI